MPAPGYDISGEIFGRVQVLRKIWNKKKNRSEYECQCSCPELTIFSTLRNNLVTGATRSCGCLKREVDRTRNRKHGHSTDKDGKSPTYVSWQKMHQRCKTDDPHHYPHYKGRGIKVCKRWSGEGGFIRFLADMGERPSLKFSLDRINFDRDYKPSNCRWATTREQALNRRPRRKKVTR